MSGIKGVSDARFYCIELFVVRQLKSKPEERVEADDPQELTVELMRHQRQALAWMRWREAQQPAGGILGKCRTSLFINRRLNKYVKCLTYVNDTIQKKNMQKPYLVTGKTLLVVV